MSTPIGGTGNRAARFSRFFFAGAMPCQAALLRIIINKPLASLACVEMVIIFILCNGSEHEVRAAETGEIETGETGCPSVAVLMLPNVNTRFDNTREL